jgi:hypothetical protein
MLIPLVFSSFCCCCSGCCDCCDWSGDGDDEDSRKESEFATFIEEKKDNITIAPSKANVIAAKLGISTKEN